MQDFLAGDILIGIEDDVMDSTQKLNRKLYQYRPGDIIFVEVIRESERLQIQLMFD